MNDLVAGSVLAQQGLAHAHAPRIDDPQFTRQPAPIDEWQQSIDQYANIRRSLIGSTQDHDSCVICWMICANVSEVLVECKESALFLRRGRENDVVACAGEPFANRCVNVMTRVPQNIYDRSRQVLVGLQAHAIGASGQGD